MRASLAINNALIKLPTLPLRQSLFIAMAMVLSALLAYFATPTPKKINELPVIEKIVPLQIGEWQYKPSIFAQVSVNSFTQNLTEAVYDQILMRTYEDKSGNQIMLAIAFAAEQRQEIKVHQPEVCYPAQGYQMLAMKTHIWRIPGYKLPISGKQLIFKNSNRMEAVSYWIRIGDSFALSGLEMRIKILKEGLKGKLTDGTLVRVSTIITQESDASDAFKIQEKFLVNLISTVNISGRDSLVPEVIINMNNI